MNNVLEVFAIIIAVCLAFIILRNTQSVEYNNNVRVIDLIAAIKQVESSDGRYLYGDYDKATNTYKAVGPLQIRESYAIDSGMDIRTWRRDALDFDKSSKAFLRYMQRYAGEYAPRDLDTIISPAAQEALSKIHNGGPNALSATGSKKEALNKYWYKVKQNVEKISITE